MKSLTKIIEALPIPGFKPAGPVKPKGPARPYKSTRIRAQVITPKGRLATVKSPTAMRKPGYGFIKYLPPIPPKRRIGTPDRHDRFDKHPKKPIKPIAYGRTIAEIKSLTQLIDEVKD